MEQTTNRSAEEPDGRTAWRSIGALAGGWADRVAVVRLARESLDRDAPAARLGLAAE